MDQRTESIRQDIDATRDSMTNKIDQIEAKVKGTVDDIKGSVEDTVDSVKQAFDIKQQVNERPWTALGASVVAGYVLGSLGSSDESARYGNTQYRPGEAFRYYPQPGAASTESSEYRASSSDYRRQGDGGSYSSPSSSQPGFMSDILDQFRDEFEALKSAAMVTASNMLRDMLKSNLPQFADEFERARKERDNQATTGTPQGSQSYDPLERAVGSSSDAAYQTHSTAAGAATYNMPSAGTTPSSTVRSSDPISNADRNTTF